MGSLEQEIGAGTPSTNSIPGVVSHEFNAESPENLRQMYQSTREVLMRRFGFEAPRVINVNDAILANPRLRMIVVIGVIQETQRLIVSVIGMPKPE